MATAGLSLLFYVPKCKCYFLLVFVICVICVCLEHGGFCCCFVLAYSFNHFWAQLKFSTAFLSSCRLCGMSLKGWHGRELLLVSLIGQMVHMKSNRLKLVHQTVSQGHYAFSNVIGNTCVLWKHTQLCFLFLLCFRWAWARGQKSPAHQIWLTERQATLGSSLRTPRSYSTWNCSSWSNAWG